MNKRLSYRSYIFDIEVLLNYVVEKRIDGKCEHKVTIRELKTNDNTSDYINTQLVKTHNLSENIIHMENEAKYWVDKQLDTNTPLEEIILKSMGFHKTEIISWKK